MEADPRHAELISKQLGLDNAKSLSNSLCNEVGKTVVLRAKYVAPDRTDIQYAVRQLAIKMRAPTKTDSGFFINSPRLPITIAFLAGGPYTRLPDYFLFLTQFIFGSWLRLL